MSFHYLYRINRKMYKRGVITSSWEALSKWFLWDVYDRVAYHLYWKHKFKLK